QVKISTSNYKIALEKIQPDVIYKVCLEILKQYSFYNALIATEDALEIYMQQFWCLTGKASDYDRPRIPMFQLLRGMVTGSNIDFVELIWKDFKYQIGTRRNSKLKQELMPYLRFTKLIVKYMMSKNDKIPKRPLSFQHVFKLDTTLGNLKFTNKGTIDPVFGMAILALMLNDDIKASAEYLEYLKKATGGSTPVVKGGKGLLSKKGVKIAVEQLRIPKRRRSKTVTEEVYESEQMDDHGDSEEIGEEEVVPLVRKRLIGVVISEEAHQESEVQEERIDNSEKLKGL
ncbi:hypothetical protein Tco_0726876, partial [Tanacetum coccineum]